MAEHARRPTLDCSDSTYRMRVGFPPALSIPCMHFDIRSQARQCASQPAPLSCRSSRVHPAVVAGATEVGAAATAVAVVGAVTAAAAALSVPHRGLVPQPRVPGSRQCASAPAGPGIATRAAGRGVVWPSCVHSGSEGCLREQRPTGSLNHPFGTGTVARHAGQLHGRWVNAGPLDGRRDPCSAAGHVVSRRLAHRRARAASRQWLTNAE